MTDNRVECPVYVPEHLVLGQFANAFRLVQDTGPEWFLDFLVYSETEKRASLVSRVRVHESFLASIRDRLVSTMTEIQMAKVPDVFMAFQTNLMEPN